MGKKYKKSLNNRGEGGDGGGGVRELIKLPGSAVLEMKSAVHSVRL